ncbi:Adenine/guanine permease AZG1 (AzgA-homolog protein) (Protein AZAGUANINE RESISTANT 1) (AtAzg1) [Durusdinium trenchii]|uniref:Adenine/guanine permease AZG1 (AzgA-homolog protein) (Protein AZAGUANINE RESISTANT 1) (AtAzg1) n=1 Tax=Durusdinium trenchii TaxID=1381693 RepID=A0ABP0NEH1_9DINO
MASLLAAYSSWLQRRPLTTKGISAGLLFSLGDWLAQKLESGGASPDLQRLAAFGSFGASWYAISQHYWFAWMERRVAVGWSPTRAALARVVTHSAVYAPFSIVSLFAWMGWAHGESSEELLAHCHPEAVFGVWAAGTVFWIPTMLAVYRCDLWGQRALELLPLMDFSSEESGPKSLTPKNRVEELITGPSCDCELGDLVALQSHGGGGPLMLPSVAVGTWSWGNESFGHGLRPGSRGAKEAARATFDAAIRHGSYFFDTAPTYGRGFAEESLGHLCHHGPYAVVATPGVPRKHFPRPQQDLTAALLSTAREDPFDVKKRGSSYFTEFRAGLTTFLAMAYILPVNSGMLSLVIPGMREQLVCATALAAFCGCWLMGILSNYPFMLAPGMGTNAFFTFTICLGRGLPYQAAFAAVFVAGWIFMLLSITGLRTLMIRLFPEGIKESIGAGVGLYLTFIAFQSSEGMGLSVKDPATLVTLNSLSPDSYDAAKLWLSLAVLCLTATLFAAKVPGAPLIGIIFGTMVCWIEGFARGEEQSVFGYPFGTKGHRDASFHIYLPTSLVAQPSLSGLSGALWSGFGAATDPAMASTFWTAVATFCYTDLLDSSGTFFAVAKVAGLTDARGNLPLARQNMAYLADAIAALIGSMLGVSTVATFAESTAGVADGAKTGLAPLVTGAVFCWRSPSRPWSPRCLPWPPGRSCACWVP